MEGAREHSANTKPWRCSSRRLPSTCSICVSTSGVLQESEPRREDLERLYIAAHTLAGTSGNLRLSGFSEVRLQDGAHFSICHERRRLRRDLHGPLAEFLSDGISVLEFDLLQISRYWRGDIWKKFRRFKERYAFAFPAASYARQQYARQHWRVADCCADDRILKPISGTGSRISTSYRRTTKFRLKYSNFSSRKPKSTSRLSANA